MLARKVQPLQLQRAPQKADMLPHAAPHCLDMSYTENRAKQLWALPTQNFVVTESHNNLHDNARALQWLVRSALRSAARLSIAYYDILAYRAFAKRAVRSGGVPLLVDLTPDCKEVRPRQMVHTLTPTFVYSRASPAAQPHQFHPWYAMTHSQSLSHRRSFRLQAIRVDPAVERPVLEKGRPGEPDDSKVSQSLS